MPSLRNISTLTLVVIIGIGTELILVTPLVVENSMRGEPREHDRLPCWYKTLGFFQQPGNSLIEEAIGHQAIRRLARAMPHGFFRPTAWAFLVMLQAGFYSFLAMFFIFIRRAWNSRRTRFMPSFRNISTLTLAVIIGIGTEFILVTPLFVAHSMQGDRCEDDCLPCWYYSLSLFQQPGDLLVEEAVRHQMIFHLARAMPPSLMVPTARVLVVLLQACMYSLLAMFFIFVRRAWKARRTHSVT